MQPLIEKETVALEHALSRILASNLSSPVDVPERNNSAMDGYALHGDDLRSDGLTRLHAIVAKAFAVKPVRQDITQASAFAS